MRITKYHLILSIAAFLLVFALALPCCSPPNKATEQYFTIVALPDTQYYSSDFPNVFTAQTAWIKNNTKTENIVFTIHLGDIVDDVLSEKQWINAENAMSELNGLKYSVLPGNHDIHAKSSRTTDYSNYDYTNYNKYFPYSEFSQYGWYKGHYPENGNQNNYAVFNALGVQLLVINIGYMYDSNDEKSLPKWCEDTMSWAKTVIDSHHDRYIILATHGYLNTDGNRIAEGQMLWDKLIKLCDNVFLVLCGHIGGEGFHISSAGADNHKVYEVLSDYQDKLKEGGEGFLRLYKFYPDKNIIHVETYSPWLHQYKSGKNSQFDIPLDISLSMRIPWYLNVLPIEP